MEYDIEWDPDNERVFKFLNRDLTTSGSYISDAYAIPCKAGDLHMWYVMPLGVYVYTKED